MDLVYICSGIIISTIIIYNLYASKNIITTNNKAEKIVNTEPIVCTSRHHMFNDNCEYSQCIYLAWFYYYMYGNRDPRINELYEFYKHIPNNSKSESLMRFKYFYDIFKYAIINLKEECITIGNYDTYDCINNHPDVNFICCTESTNVFSFNGLLMINATDNILCFFIHPGSVYYFTRNKLTEPKNFPPKTDMKSIVDYMPESHNLF